MAGVAALTGRYRVHTLQRKLCEFVIETFGLVPACRLVTGTTVSQLF